MASDKCKEAIVSFIQKSCDWPILDESRFNDKERYAGWYERLTTPRNWRRVEKNVLKDGTIVRKFDLAAKGIIASAIVEEKNDAIEIVELKDGLDTLGSTIVYRRKNGKR